MADKADYQTQDYFRREGLDLGAWAEQFPQIPKIVYGCMKIGKSWDKGPCRQQEVDDFLPMLETCMESGLNFFDHADIYCRGKSEEVFGLAAKELKLPRESYILQSKCGIVLPDSPEQSPYYNFDVAYVISSVEGILKRLRTDYLDILLLHRPDALVEPEELAAAFEQLNQQGKVKFFGVSNHSAGQIKLLEKYLPFPLLCNQMQASLQRPEILASGLEYNTPNPVSEHFDVLEFMQLEGIRLQAWSPLGGGKLMSKANSPKEMTALQQLLEEMSAEYSCSVSALALAWLLQHPAKMQLVVGTTKPERLREILKATEIQLSKPEWYQLLVSARKNNLP